MKERRQIAVVDGRVKGKINGTVLHSERNTGIEGSLCTIETETQYWLCRIGYVDITNAAHSNPAFANLIATRGSIQHISKNADCEKITLEVLCRVGKDSKEVESFSGNPNSGTPIYFIDNEEYEMFQPAKKRRAFIGNIPQNRSVDVSITVKDYDRNAPKELSFGHAIHRVVLGRTGSGKTVMETVILVSRLASNLALGAIIPNTKNDLFNVDSTHGFSWSFKKGIEDSGRKIIIIEIKDIRLTSKSAYKRLLQKVLPKIVSMNSDKAQDIASSLYSKIKTDWEYEDFLDVLIDLLGRQDFWASKDSNNSKLSSLQNERIDLGKKHFFQGMVKSYFEGDIKIDDIINGALYKSQIYGINGFTGNERQKDIIITELVKGLKKQAEINAGKEKYANCEFFLDEASRFVPQQPKDEAQRKIKDSVIDALQTTRSMGVSWTIVAQSTANLDKNVLRQTHTKYIGKGLNIGADKSNIENLIGKDVYEQFQDFCSSCQYPWLVIGEEVNLGGSSSYIMFEPYGGNLNEVLKEKNPHIWETTW